MPKSKHDSPTPIGKKVMKISATQEILKQAVVKSNAKKKPNRYEALIEDVFFSKYKDGLTQFEFSRSEFEHRAEALGIALPKNVGDVLYAFRYRSKLPTAIRDTEKDGLEWIIEGAGIAKYRFKLVKLNRIVPRSELLAIKVPDATPEIIGAYTLGDEQALLAKVRYNRLIDIFLGVNAYSLQNHLRTTVKEVGQIEIDELYVAIDRHGSQYIVPVQAKGGTDQHGVVQTSQDIACCVEKFPQLLCRPVSAQFMSNNKIALFELIVIDGELKVLDEKHYQLVPSSEISIEDLDRYAMASGRLIK